MSREKEEEKTCVFPKHKIMMKKSEHTPRHKIELKWHPEPGCHRIFSNDIEVGILRPDGSITDSDFNIISYDTASGFAELFGLDEDQAEAFMMKLTKNFIVGWPGRT